MQAVNVKKITSILFVEEVEPAGHLITFAQQGAAAQP